LKKKTYKTKKKEKRCGERETRQKKNKKTKNYLEKATLSPTRFIILVT